MDRAAFPIVYCASNCTVVVLSYLFTFGKLVFRPGNIKVYK